MHAIDLARTPLSAATRGSARAETDAAAALRLVLTRHRRLQRLLGMRAPAIVLRNEGRLLRAALGALTGAGGTQAEARRAAR